MTKKITLPITDEAIRDLKAGDSVLLTGTILTGRDAAHKRLFELIEQGKELPVDIKGELIYYVGPAPAKEGYAVGPAGPTSSYRMDKYAPALLDLGLKGMIGKGARNQAVIDAMVRNGCVYFAAIGGAAALIAKSITWAPRLSDAIPLRIFPASSRSTARETMSMKRNRSSIERFEFGAFI